MIETIDRSRVCQIVTEEVTHLLRNEGLDFVELNEDMSLLDDLGFSSLALLDLMVGLERALGCRFDDIDTWSASEDQTGGPRFRLRSIVDAALETVRAQRAGVA